MARNALLIEITDEDIAWAQKQDRYACAIVRAIQRAIPESIFVKADSKEIAFSIREDGKTGMRYTFPVPPEVRDKVIKPFDQGLPIDPEYRTFSVVADSAEPMNHASKGRMRERRVRDASRAKEMRKRSKSTNVRSANRFLDEKAEESE